MITGCGGAASTPTPIPLPKPICGGGVKVAIPDALSCQQIASIAIARLRADAPQQLARGVVSIEVVLASCPRDSLPPMVDCGTETWAQLVTITFPPQVAGGPFEPSLTVVVAPVSGRVLGIMNPLME